MIFKQNVNIPSSNKIVEHNIEACIKCGSDDIKVDEYEDNYGFISTVKCKQCKQEIKSNTDLPAAIIKWNDANNILIVISANERLINDLKSETKALKKLLKKRKGAKQKI